MRRELRREGEKRNSFLGLRREVDGGVRGRTNGFLVCSTVQNNGDEPDDEKEGGCEVS